MFDAIVQEGNPVLRHTARAVAKKDIGSPELMKLIARMKKLLAAEKNGVGLAAPQVGESLRLFIVSGRVFEDDESEDNSETTHEDMVFINPEPVRFSRAKEEMSEGCLSVRGKYGKVVRHEKATIRALDEAGRAFVRHGSGLLAQIFQHELDHLEGILYIDKATHLEPWEESADEEAKPRTKSKTPKHSLKEKARNTTAS